MNDLKQFGSRIPDTWSFSFILPSIKTLYLIETENLTINFKKSCDTTALSKGTNFAKVCCVFLKKAIINKVKVVLVLKEIFSKSTYMGLLK